MPFSAANKLQVPVQEFLVRNGACCSAVIPYGKLSYGQIPMMPPISAEYATR